MSQRQCTSPSPEQPVLQAQYRLTEDMQPTGSVSSIPALWVNSGSVPSDGPLITQIQNCNALKPDQVNWANFKKMKDNTAHGGGSYVWSTYNVHTHQSTSVPSYSRKVSGLCLVGASHSRNILCKIEIFGNELL